MAAGLGYPRRFSVELDGMLDFTTYDSPRGRVMAGGEVFLADHYALRAGWRYDAGTQINSPSVGFGYIDPRWGVELGVRTTSSRALAETLGVLSLRYFYDATGRQRARRGRGSPDRLVVTGRGLQRWHASSMALSASLGMSASVTPSAREPSGSPTRLRSVSVARRRSSCRRIEGVRTRSSLRRSALVEVDDRGQAQRVREPVVQPLLARQRMRERVARAEPFWNATAPIIAAFIMAPRASEVVAVLDRPGRVLRAELEAAERDRVGHGVVARASSRPRGSA
jgi:hypothetical protein